MKKSKLYFVTGNPNKEQLEEAESVGAKIRDASKYHEGDFLENCSVVYGDVPDAYKKIEGVEVKEAKAKATTKKKKSKENK
ncbi:MAG: hypothetical protein ACRBCK_10085 [Alphaproteobacteria bacterium]